MSKNWVTILLGVAGAIYLLNFTFGVIELIPDNAPIIGNLDEFGASALVLNALRELKLLR